MWIDIFDTTLEEAVQLVTDTYNTMGALEAERADRMHGKFDFRHAICILDQYGKHYPKSPWVVELAGRLLTDYGTARGGIPSSFEVEQWSYRECTGYCMTFVGGPTEPTRRTELYASPTTNELCLHGREEVYILPRLDKTAQVAAESQNSGPPITGPDEIIEVDEKGTVRMVSNNT